MRFKNLNKEEEEKNSASQPVVRTNWEFILKQKKSNELMQRAIANFQNKSL